MRKRARKVERAVVATLSIYLEAIISGSGVTLLRDKRPVWIAADEMERLCEEWAAFRRPNEQTAPDPPPADLGGDKL